MRRFTRQELYRMMAAGVLDGIRIELIDGLLVEKTREGNIHAATRDEVTDILEAIFGSGFWVRSGATLDLSDSCVVDPDVAVVVGDADHPEEDNPTTALLVVEISDRTLAFDQTAKASLYAAVGIADYWIVNIPDRQLEIRRNPQPDSTAEFGHSYGSLTTLKPGDTATPLAAPSGVVPVDRLFF
jgi:Uma2 family endonuclease